MSVTKLLLESEKVSDNGELLKTAQKRGGAAEQRSSVAIESRELCTARKRQRIARGWEVKNHLLYRKMMDGRMKGRKPCFYQSIYVYKLMLYSD